MNGVLFNVNRLGGGCYLLIEAGGCFVLNEVRLKIHLISNCIAFEFASTWSA